MIAIIRFKTTTPTDKMDGLHKRLRKGLSFIIGKDISVTLEEHKNF